MRRRVREKAAEIERYGSEKDKKILEIINELVFDDFCYIKLDIKLAFQTRYFLGYSKKEAQDLYIELVQASVALSNKGRYTQVEKK